MFDSYIQLTKNQYEATFWMLNDCLNKCDDSFWYEPVANLTYSQAAFHAIFFTDLYLGDSVEAQRDQSFHQANLDYFRDYEELAGRKQELQYEKPKTLAYLQFCREKANRVLSEATIESLEAPSGIGWLEMNRAESYLYNLKHLHHHVAQLSLRLRQNQGEGADWANSGWKK